MVLVRPVETHFVHFWCSVAKMVFRRLVEAHFMHFWGLVAKWLSGGLWRLIVCIFAGFEDFLAFYARMNIGFVNLRVYRQRMCQISSLFTLE